MISHLRSCAKLEALALTLLKPSFFVRPIRITQFCIMRFGPGAGWPCRPLFTQAAASARARYQRGWAREDRLALEAGCSPKSGSSLSLSLSLGRGDDTVGSPLSLSLSLCNAARALPELESGLCIAALRGLRSLPHPLGM